jgi:enoyl-CoA hydratase
VTDDEVLTERDGAILVITLNRPKARNAVNSALARGLAAAVDTLDADPELSVGVLTGAGGSFCSGMDLKAFLQGELPVVEGRGFAGITITPPEKPMIAAVEGYA